MKHKNAVVDAIWDFNNAGAKMLYINAKHIMESNLYQTSLEVFSFRTIFQTYVSVYIVNKKSLIDLQNIQQIIATLTKNYKVSKKSLYLLKIEANSYYFMCIWRCILTLNIQNLIFYNLLNVQLKLFLLIRKLYKPIT